MSPIAAAVTNCCDAVSFFINAILILQGMAFNYGVALGAVGALLAPLGALFPVRIASIRAGLVVYRGIPARLS